MGKKATQTKEALRIVALQDSAAYWAEKGWLAIVGPGGLGKTHTVEQLLAKRRIETELQTKPICLTMPRRQLPSLFDMRTLENRSSSAFKKAKERPR